MEKPCLFQHGFAWPRPELTAQEIDGKLPDAEGLIRIPPEDDLMTHAASVPALRQVYLMITGSSEEDLMI